jgi:hypothetical protein
MVRLLRWDCGIGSEARVPIGFAARRKKRSAIAACAGALPACALVHRDGVRRTRRVAGLFVLCICLSLALPQASGAGDLALGMSRRGVVALLGPPDAVRLERNGVVCLTYDVHRRWLWLRLFGERTEVVALKDDHLVDDDTVRTRDVRFHCSDVAGRWDPPMRPPLVTCDHCQY